MFKFISFAITLATVAAQFTDECSNYGDCLSCLNITAGHATGGRENCGWCHTDINYQNGTEGKRCADIRDHPWNCRDEFDTFKCSAGWVCDPIKGQCIVGKPGEGYALNSTCTVFCGDPTPPADQKKYKCNITDFTCQTCKPGDSACVTDRNAACGNCKDTVDTFKCDKTDPKAPKCNKCPANETSGCADRNTACHSCIPPQNKQSCNNKTMKCEHTNSTSGTDKNTCDQSCGHITPANLLGTWRGLNVKNGMPGIFDMGEFDMVFGNNNLTVIYPNRTQVIYDVYTTNPGKFIISKDGKNVTVVYSTLKNLKHTIALGLSTYGTVDSPESFRQGMNSDKADNAVMWKCNAWGGDKCKFDVLNMDTELVGKRNLKAVGKAQFGNDDCNKFADCHACITAEEGGIKCGWCLGDTLDYKGIGKTSYKCGGFQAGKPYNFTCGIDFRTVDCKGYRCDVSASKCSISDDGQFPTLPSCNIVCSQPIKYAKCNPMNKKCDIKCNKGDPGCYNRDFCDTTCDAPHSKCNSITGKCDDCDIKDPNCNQLKTDCEQSCKHLSFSKCDKTTGKCLSCSKDQPTAGCIPDDACNKQCELPPPGYKCNWSAQPQPKCEKQKVGGMAQDKCKENCAGVQYQKCNFKTNKCDDCTVHKDKGCQFTKAYCDAVQKAGRCKTPQLDGLYRKIEVNKKYIKGEYDLLFKDSKMYMQYFDTKVETKELGEFKQTGVTDEGLVTFEVMNFKKDDKIWPFDTLHGVYKEAFGQDNIFKFLEIAFSKDEIKDLDQGLDGVNGRYWVGVKCISAQNCDFKKASPETMSQTPADINEFEELQFFTN